MKHEVSFLEWLKTGQFGPFTIGIPRDDLLSLLGPPTAISTLSNSQRRRSERPTYWCYGDVQLAFSYPEDRLDMIQLDYRDEAYGAMTGGPSMELNLWPLLPGTSLTTLLEGAKAQGLMVTQYFPTVGESTGNVYLVIGAGIEAIYRPKSENDEAGSPLRLDSVYHSAHGPFSKRGGQSREPIQF